VLWLKRGLKQLLPPLAVEGIRLVFPRSAAPRENLDAKPAGRATPLPTHREPLHWEMVANSADAWTAHEGWGHRSIVETQRDKWNGFLQSAARPRPLGRSHEAASGAAPMDVAAHNTIMTFGYVLARAAHGKRGISVLDWGGGLGHYYVYARELLPEVALDYVVKDLPSLCAAGVELLPDVTFAHDESVALSRRYDLVFASSSVHYAQDHYNLIDRLCESTGGWLLITRTPMIEDHDDFVVVQRPHAYGYMTEYAGWFMNRSRLLKHMASRGFCLEREFVVGEAAHVPNAPEDAQYAGFLFRRLAS
jgi:putative methyltransferase (TIGR04325 family)